MALNQLPVFLPPLALFRFHFLTTLELHPVEEIASQSKFTFASIYNNFAQRRDVSHCHETICPAEKIFFETRKGIINDGKKKKRIKKTGTKYDTKNSISLIAILTPILQYTLTANVRLLKEYECYLKFQYSRSQLTFLNLISQDCFPFRNKDLFRVISSMASSLFFSGRFQNSKCKFRS